MLSYLVFISSLCVIVLIHELGHYAVARCFNVAVDVFSIGFGPAIWRYKAKNSLTEFRVTPILLGGYVRFAESLQHQKQQYLITDISLWRQILILLAGPIANLVLAFLGLVLFFKIGAYVLLPYIGEVPSNSYASSLGFQKGAKIVSINDTPVESWEQALQQIEYLGSPLNISLLRPNSNEIYQIHLHDIKSEDFFKKLGLVPFTPELPAIIGSVMADSAASQAGLQMGDKILALDGRPIRTMLQVSEYISKHPNEKITLNFVRNGRIQKIDFFTDRVYENQKPYGRLGISSLGLEHFPQWFVYHQDNWQQAMTKSFKAMHQFLGLQLSVWFHLNDQLSQLSGPVGMARAANQAWTAGLKMFLMYWVWLNIGLAVVNLLPLPILDGGQCFMLILRKLFPSVLTEERQKMVLIWSLIFIVGLFVTGLFNDLSV
jgi:regulator of sigma E protease